MLEGKSQERGEGMPIETRQSALGEIIVKLQNAVSRYDCIVHETKGRLQTIKRDDVPLPTDEVTKEKEPDSVIEEINRLIRRLNDLNEKAQENLRHLSEIV